MNNQLLQLDLIFNAINQQPELTLQKLVESGYKSEDIAKLILVGVLQGKIKPELGLAIMQALQGGQRKMRHGAKLNYIRTLKNQCPEGLEPYYYKKGGKVGCGCKGKKMEDGGELKNKNNVVDKFKQQRNNNNSTDKKSVLKKSSPSSLKKEEEFKKARQWSEMHKRTNQAHNNRDWVEGDKCGGKVKKHLKGNILSLLK